MRHVTLAFVSLLFLAVAPGALSQAPTHRTNNELPMYGGMTETDAQRQAD